MPLEELHEWGAFFKLRREAEKAAMERSKKGGA